MTVKVGQVWMKNPDRWSTEGGQLIIVEEVIFLEQKGGTIVCYRYCYDYIHNKASWPVDNFLSRMILIKDV